jgi:hypothetical protein
MDGWRDGLLHSCLAVWLDEALRKNFLTGTQINGKSGVQTAETSAY